MPNGTYGGVRGRKMKVGRKLLHFPPTRFNLLESAIYLPYTIANTSNNCEQSSDSVLWLVQDLPF
ncbi:hypothetical protein K210099B7_38610 [Bacteroides xylanisolvens]